MPNSKKSRVKKTSPNLRHGANKFEQEMREDRNKDLNRTPWQKAKDKRFYSPDRTAKRKKFYANA